MAERRKREDCHGACDSCGRLGLLHWDGAEELCRACSTSRQIRDLQTALAMERIDVPSDQAQCIVTLHSMHDRAISHDNMRAAVAYAEAIIALYRTLLNP